jgi:chromosome segregation ATPase
MSHDANRTEVGWVHPDAHRVITQQRDEAQRELQASREELVALQHRLDEAHAEILALRKRDPVIQRALDEAYRETHPIEKATRQGENIDELAPKFQVSHDPWNNADARNQGS